MKKNIGILLLILSLLLLFLAAVYFFLEPYRIKTQQEIYLEQVEHPQPGLDYDLIVVGAEPEGIAAAVQGARLGLKTLLISGSDQVGGLFTSGGMSILDQNYDPEVRHLLSNTFYTEFVAGVNQITYHAAYSHANAFDADDALIYFNRIIAAESNLTLRLGVKNIRPLLNGNRMIGIRSSSDGHEVTSLAQIVIDATADGDIAALSGCPYTFGMEDIGFKYYFQVPTLVFYLDGVRWDQLADRLPRNMGIVYNNACLISHDVMRPYLPADPYIRFRGLNVARQRHDAVAINAMLLFKVNPLNPESRQEAIARGEAEARRVAEYIRQTIPGFESAAFQGIARTLYVRETRHIETEYTLSILDCLSNRDFPDKIALASYPLDLQPRFLNDFPDGQILGNPAVYSIPIRSIVPKTIDNLLVVGRSAGYSSLAHSSARVVPPGMDEGQAAACLALVSLVEGITPRQAIRDDALVNYIQKLLHPDGRYLKPFHHPSGLEPYLGDAGVLAAIQAGLVQLGYNNDYSVLDRPAADADRVIRTLSRYILRDKFTDTPPARIFNPDNQAVLDLIRQTLPQLQPFSSYRQLLEGQVITADTFNRISSQDPMPSQDLYNLCYEVLSYLDQQQPLTAQDQGL